MTDKYAAYLVMLSQRDQAIITLALLALGVCFSWWVLHYAPGYDRPWFQRLVIGAGIGLYVVTFLFLYFMPVPK